MITGETSDRLFAFMGFLLLTFLCPSRRCLYARNANDREAFKQVVPDRIALLVSDCIWGVSASLKTVIDVLQCSRSRTGNQAGVDMCKDRARCHGDDGRWGCMLQRMQPSIISPISGSQSIGICTSYLTRTDPESLTSIPACRKI
jgi:hypothetical protein